MPRSAAAFHLWEISQIYSNADGSVQFIEMYNASNNEQFVANQNIIASRDGGQDSRTFTFPSNLPSSQTGGRFVLIATGPVVGVEPDYTLPPNFIHIEFADEARVHFPFSEVNATLSYPSIPTDGVRSLEVTGAVRDPATVTNFAGDTGILEAPDPGPETAYGYEVEDGRIETGGGFLGTLHVEHAPWIYSFGTAAWWYLPDPESNLTEAPGAWIWLPRE